MPLGPFFLLSHKEPEPPKDSGLVQSIKSVNFYLRVIIHTGEQ